MQKQIFLILAFLLLSSPAFAGFEEGKSAYDRKDWMTAIRELRPLAEAGDDRAMIVLANMYNEGMGVVQNHSEALSLYKRAALEKNNAEAMLAVGAMYTSGIGTDSNLNTAKQWFERAALLGSQTGAHFYATILLRGNNSATDDIQPDVYNAYKWFKIAAGKNPTSKMQANSLEIAKRIGEKKLTPEQTAQADKEAVEWQPVDAASLGPPPN